MTGSASEEANEPQNKEEMIERINQEWDRLEALIDSHNEAQLTRLKDAVGWSTKDHLSHLTAWERYMLLLIRDRQPRHVGLGIDQSVNDSEDFDPINAEIKRQTEGQSLAEVREERRRVHAELCSLLESLPEDDLRRPYSFFDPDGEDAPIYIWINGNTWGHYDEHYDWIAAILDAPTSD